MRVDDDGVLLASQWFDRLAANGWRPEARLFVEILKLAIEDLTARPPCPRGAVRRRSFCTSRAKADKRSFTVRCDYL